MADKKQTQILLINDMAGYGKVALSVMIPVLSHLRFETFNSPTALVSNTLDYGQFDILDTTEYMENTLLVWKKLMKRLCSIADVIVPNITEACFLSEYTVKHTYSEPEIEVIANRLHTLGAKSVVITSANINGRKMFTVVKSSPKNSCILLPYGRNTRCVFQVQGTILWRL